MFIVSCPFFLIVFFELSGDDDCHPRFSSQCFVGKKLALMAGDLFLFFLSFLSGKEILICT